MSRLELLYTCVANLAKEAEKNGLKLPEQLCHYTQADDRNRVIYHNRSEETAGKIATVLRDAAKRKELCGTDYDESNNYCLLIKTVSVNAKHRAEQQRYRNTEEFRKLSRFRNGVETIPSTLRRKYQVDKMPVRGLIRGRFWFGCKIGALNFRKFCKYMQSLENCAQNTVMA